MTAEAEFGDQALPGGPEWPADIAIGDAVLDADGVPWRVLNRPLGEPCNGLFRALDGSGQQCYGEHMRTPVTVWAQP